ncbi:hypothetical protein [Clostridium sp. Marseille-P3244]|uniref:hypothetical protein n=1 Tax=Clostridium sp. Marseille-P3244 TaxID=1871020 RepID=UPI001160B4A4|nr:hypothetical protein [Clostridium sp. Marseille-P3244]
MEWALARSEEHTAELIKERGRVGLLVKKRVPLRTECVREIDQKLPLKHIKIFKRNSKKRGKKGDRHFLKSACPLFPPFSDNSNNFRSFPVSQKM